jgi:anti-anti-sigma factor
MIHNQQSKPLVEVSENSNEVVFIIKGDLEQGRMSDFSRAMDLELKKKQDRDLVIDLDRCRFVDSGNLGVISQAHRDLSSRGRALRLINVQKGVAATLACTSLDKIFDIRLKNGG